MACCLPFTVSVGVGWGSHSWLTPRVGRIRDQHALLSTAGGQGVRGGWVPLLSVLSPWQSSRSQVPDGQLGWPGGKGGPVAMPLGPHGLAAAVRLPEEGQMVLAQGSTSPWGLGLCHDVLKPGRDIHLEGLVVLDEAVFKQLVILWSLPVVFSKAVFDK